MEVVVADRWTPGSLADRVSLLVWAVDGDFRRDAVRALADEVQAMQERLASLESAAKLLRAEEREAATAEERRAVVAWLRRDLTTRSAIVSMGGVLAAHAYGQVEALQEMADSIERGEHVAEGESDE
jgi:hypothetical protein